MPPRRTSSLWDDVPPELLEAYRIGIGPDCSDATVLLTGGSGIAGPDGRWIEGQLFNKTGLVCAEIDLAATTEYKHDLDVVGHYSREDIFNSVWIAERRNLFAGLKTIHPTNLRPEVELAPVCLKSCL